MDIKRIARVLLGATALLIVPFTASFFVDGWLWTAFDYVFAWVMFAGAGLGYAFVARTGNTIAYRAAVGLGVLGVFLLIWVNGAVGIIGNEDNPANGMYLAVLITGFLGLVLSRMKAKGMAVTMFAVAAVQMLVPTVVLLFWDTGATVAGESFWGSVGAYGVFMLNTVFATIWAGSGLLFRQAGETDSNQA